MSLASKNWVERRIEESRRPAHPPRLSAPGGGKWATDYVWVGGKRLTIPENTNGYDCLKVYLDGETTPEWVETMPTDEQDENAETFDMKKLQIHLPGNFGR